MFPRIQNHNQNNDLYVPYPKVMKKSSLYVRSKKDTYISNLKKLRDYLCYEDKQNVGDLQRLKNIHRKSQSLNAVNKNQNQNNRFNEKMKKQNIKKRNNTQNIRPISPPCPYKRKITLSEVLDFSSKNKQNMISFKFHKNRIN